MATKKKPAPKPKTKAAKTKPAAAKVATPKVEATPAKAEPAEGSLGAQAFVTLDQLHASKLNPRTTFDDEGIKALAASIAENGLMQNLVVRKDGKAFEIVAGERRYRALKLLAKDGKAPRQIPVRILEGNDNAVRALALVENLQREDLNPMDEARAFAELRRMNWDNAAIADKIGKTPRHVQLRLELVDKLHANVQVALESGDIKLAHARALTIATPEEQKEIVKLIPKDPELMANAAAIGSHITSNRPDVRSAIFDLKLYDGGYLDEDGEPLKAPTSASKAPWRAVFADAAKARALQDAAVETLKAKLKAKWQWVKVHNGYFYPHDSYTKNPNTAIAGAVIVRGKHSGRQGFEIEIHEGLVPRSGKSAPGENSKDRKAREAAARKREKERQARVVAVKATKTVISDLLQAEPRLALAYHLADEATSWRYRLSAGEMAKHAASLPKVFSGFLGKDRNRTFKGERMASFAAIKNASLDDLLAGLAFHVALNERPGTWSRDDKLTRDEAALADSLSVEVSDAVRPKLPKGEKPPVKLKAAPKAEKKKPATAVKPGADAKPAKPEKPKKPAKAKQKAAAAVVIPEAAGDGTAPHQAAGAVEPKCWKCGCTEDKACSVNGTPCHWVTPDLCSACADKANEAAEGDDKPLSIAYSGGENEAPAPSVAEPATEAALGGVVAGGDDFPGIPAFLVRT